MLQFTTRGSVRRILSWWERTVVATKDIQTEICINTTGGLHILLSNAAFRQCHPLLNLRSGQGDCGHAETTSGRFKNSTPRCPQSKHNEELSVRLLVHFTTLSLKLFCVYLLTKFCNVLLLLMVNNRSSTSNPPPSALVSYLYEAHISPIVSPHSMF